MLAERSGHRPRGRELPPVGVQDVKGPAQQFGDDRAHVLDPAAADHDRGHPVVRARRSLHSGASSPDDLVDGAQLVQCGLGLFQEAGIVDGDRGVRGERAEQRHLLLVEGALAAVGRRQDPDHPAAQLHRHAQDRDHALLGDRRVDEVPVLEPSVP